MNTPIVLEFSPPKATLQARASSRVKANRIDSLGEESQAQKNEASSFVSERTRKIEEIAPPQEASGNPYIALACFSAISPITGSLYI